jgi:hypothetical protein
MKKLKSQDRLLIYPNRILFCCHLTPGANLAIVMYNAALWKIYNKLFENKNIIFYFDKNALVYYNDGVVVVNFQVVGLVVCVMWGQFKYKRMLSKKLTFASFVCALEVDDWKRLMAAAILFHGPGTDVMIFKILSGPLQFLFRTFKKWPITR